MTSKAHLEGNARYLEKLDDIKIRVPKGRRDELHAAADAAGQSLNQFILDAIDERMARLGRAERPFAPPPGEWCEGCKKLGSRQYTPEGAEPEPERPWCFAYLCELEGTEDKARKCEECTEKAHTA